MQGEAHPSSPQPVEVAGMDLWVLQLDQGVPLGTLAGAQGWVWGSVAIQSCLGHPHTGSLPRDGHVPMSCGNPWCWSLAAREVGDIQHQGTAVPL